jgi:hypothetical protein
MQGYLGKRKGGKQNENKTGGQRNLPGVQKAAHGDPVLGLWREMLSSAPVDIKAPL